MIKIQGEEFNCDILIQFSVLQKVIFKLASTVDSLTEKVDVLENNLVSKSKKIGELEKKLNINLQNHENRIKNLENKKSSLNLDNIQNSDININPNVKQLKTSLDNKKENVDNMLIETNLNNKENEDINKNLQTTKPNNNNDLLASNLSEANEENNINEMNNIKEQNSKNVLENSEENQDKIDNDNNLLNQNNNDEDNNNDLLNQNNDDNNNNNVQIKSTTNTKSIITNKYIIESDNKYLPRDKTSPELLSMLFKKYSDLEKKINNLDNSKNEISKLKTLLNDNSSKIENIEKNNNDFNNNLSEMDNKLSEMKRSYDEIKVKVEDFNIYELFKDNGDGNLDASKILIQALENKVFKKFGMVDERMKKNETDIFNIKNNITNYDNLIESIKRENEKLKKLFEEYDKNYNEDKENNNKNFEDINNNIENIYKKLSDFDSNKNNINIDNNNNINNEKISEMENKFNEKLNEMLVKNSENSNNNPEATNEINNLLNDLNKRINMLEKSLKISMSNFTDSKNAIEFLKSEIENKINKNDFLDLSNKVKSIDLFTKDSSFKLESTSDEIEKLNGEIAMLTRKFEYISGQINSISNKDISSSSNNKNKQPIFDITKFIDVPRFNENNKLIFNKIDNNKLLIEDLQRNIEEILYRLKHTPTEVDLKTLSQNLSKNLDDLKVFCSKRFIDKLDYNKTIRLLETNIKTVTESYNKKMEGGDNWLLAKKPMYQCASCERVLTDLKQNPDDFIPWKKLQKDDNYRMGHGFSRMLQMVNTDILKVAEINRENKKGYISDEEKEKDGNKEKSTNVKLPKVGNSVKLNREDLENLNNIDYYNNDTSDNGPKVTKIIKRNKVIKESINSINVNDNNNNNGMMVVNDNKKN